MKKYVQLSILAGAILIGIPGLAGLPGTHAYAQVVINEFQSSNSSILADDDGEYVDWIELFNTSDSLVDLSHHGLSDNLSRPFKWTFQQGTTIEPGGFLLIWASGKDRRDPESPLHTNFSIAQSGEPLLLTNAITGERLDEVPPIEIPSDVSYGRSPDGGSKWVFFSEPTPGRSNTEGDPSQLLPPVLFSEPGGFHTGPFDLELTLDGNDSGLEIRYTLDGSGPGPESPLYTEPIAIEDRSGEPNDLSTILDISHNYANATLPADKVFKGTVVRARAFSRGQSSRVYTRTFFVSPEGHQRFQLPVITLSTHRDSLFGYERGIYMLGKVWDDHGRSHSLGAAANYNRRGDDWERPVHMEMYETDGRPVIAQDIGLRLHGGASRAFPQKSFRLYSRSDYGTSRFRYRFFPEMELDDFNRLILRNSGQDVVMTLFRDAYIQESVKHMRFPTMATRAVIVFLNGEYWGIYNIRERYDVHYIETHYGVDRDRVDLMTGHASLKDGERQHYDALRNYIAQNDPGIEEHFRHIQTMMDTDNFMDYYIAQIYARNTDWPHNNVDYFRNRTAYNPDAAIPEQDGRWRWMMFDMDFSFGWQPGPGGWAPYRPSDWNRPKHYDRKSYIQNMFAHLDGYPGTHRSWAAFFYHRLMRNDDYRQAFVNRFADMLNTTWRPERMVAILDSMQAIYTPEIEEHIIRWNKTEPDNWDFYWRPFITYDEWEEEVQVMRRFVEQRHSYQWDHLMDFAGRGLMDITLDNRHPDRGCIRFNTIAIHPSTPGVDDDPWPWTGTYFRNRPYIITAEPEEGYRFRRWLEVADGDTLVRSLNDTLEVVLTRHKHLIAEFVEQHVHAGNESDQPTSFRVRQNYPNPFNDQTVLAYQLPEAADVTVTVYRVDGRRVTEIRNTGQAAGHHTVHLDATGWATGVYLARVTARTGSALLSPGKTIKMVLVR